MARQEKTRTSEAPRSESLPITRRCDAHLRHLRQGKNSDFTASGTSSVAGRRLRGPVPRVVSAAIATLSDGY